jgi:predicted RNA-binding Zn-ribbon protein involved in translation (DUF1610 family)
MTDLYFFPCISCGMPVTANDLICPHCGKNQFVRQDDGKPMTDSSEMPNGTDNQTQSL